MSSFLSENLKKLRKKAGLSQNALAKKLNVSQTAIYYWENGKREPDLDTIFKLSDIFNIGVDDILGIENSLPEDIALQMEQEYLQNFKNDVANISFEHLSDSELNDLEECSDLLFNSFFALNLCGKKEAAKRVKELTYIDKYTKAEDTKMPKPLKFNAVAAHERTDIEVTDEMRAADDAIMEDDDF